MDSLTEEFFIPSSRCHYEISVTLYRPQEAKPKHLPVIVMGHGIGAIKSGGLSPFAQAFNSAGYAAITFDYIGFGQSGGVPRHVLNVQHELQDFRDVLAWVRHDDQSEWVDASRIVAWGTSFGGMHVTALMSDDHLLAAGIAQCPLVDGRERPAKMPLTYTLSLTARALVDAIHSIVSTEGSIHVPLVSDGSTAALMASPEAMEGWARIAPTNGEPQPMTIAARSLFSILASRPVLHIHKSTHPYLVVLPTWDNEASLDAAEKCVRNAPFGECLRVEGGHFDLYDGGPSFGKNVDGQLAFLKRVLRT